MQGNQRDFLGLGPTGQLQVQVQAGGGHTAAASLSVADSIGSWLLKPSLVAPSRIVWRFSLGFADPAPVLPMGSPDKPLPWIGTAGIGYMRAGLVIAVFSGGGNATNLTATVSLSKDGVALAPTPPDSMDFPAGAMAAPDVVRTAVMQLLLGR